MPLHRGIATEPAVPGPTRGVYFIASDEVLEFTIAFLNSFRMHNPDLPLCLVPFSDCVDKTLAKQSAFDFSVWSDHSALRRCDAISTQFHGSPTGQYRKLALWEGCYDEFVYIDVDTVVLTSLDFVFPLVRIFGLLTSHSDIPSIRKWVWKDSIETARVLTPRQLRFSASTGFVASVRGNLSLDEAVRKLPKL